MSTVKDTKRGTWTAQFYYTGEDGKRHRKKKRGFRLKKEAVEFEENFLRKHDVKIYPFDYYANLYLEDIKNRVRKSSFEQKKYLLDKKVIPFFHNKVMKEITPRDIREFQNELLDYTQPNGKPYSSTYLKSIYNQLKAVFNYGIRFCDLKENPCLKAGSLGSTKCDEKKFWTLDQYTAFQKVIRTKKPAHSLAIELLFFSGIRIGELLALCPADIDTKRNIIHINKTYHRQNGYDVISLPKTTKSKRDITIPKPLIDRLIFFIDDNKDLIASTNRIFSFSSASLRYTIRQYAPRAKVPVIRIHDLRHSHVSLLINMGFNVSVIADRLGHEKVQTTLDIYTHLSQKNRQEVSDQLEELLIAELSNNKSDEENEMELQQMIG